MYSVNLAQKLSICSNRDRLEVQIIFLTVWLTRSSLTTCTVLGVWLKATSFLEATLRQYSTYNKDPLVQPTQYFIGALCQKKKRKNNHNTIYHPCEGHTNTRTYWTCKMYIIQCNILLRETAFLCCYALFWWGTPYNQAY